MKKKYTLIDEVYMYQQGKVKRWGEAQIILAGTLRGKYREVISKEVFHDIEEKLKNAELTIGHCTGDLLEDIELAEGLYDAGFDLFTSINAEDKAYVHLEINGIRIAVLTCIHGQTKANLITEAKLNGAEFVLVYMHCKEKEQIKYAQTLADAGADYIFGCNMKKIRPYSVILTEDNRTVPVIYSGGDLLSEKGPSAIYELNLSRNGEGRVIIKSTGYYPCMMAEQLVRMDERLKHCDIEEQIKLEEGLFYVHTSLGTHHGLTCYAEIEPSLQDRFIKAKTPQEQQFGILPKVIAKKPQMRQVEKHDDYVLNEETGHYCRKKNIGGREAVFLCAGMIEYDINLENDAACFGEFEFMKSFKAVGDLLADADFVVGNLAAIASAEYPSMGEVSLEHRKIGYRNCRIEFIDALRKAGFTGLAAANAYNTGLGIAGIYDTEAQIRKAGMISSGIGFEKNPVIEINGIKIGLISITAACLNYKYTLDGEGVAACINLFDENRSMKEIQQAKEKGAEYILAYLNCGANKRMLPLEERKRMAERLAEMGADYVICTAARELSPYYRYQTVDKRIVPIATSLGSFITGRKDKEAFNGAILKLFVRKTFDGTIEVDDKYVPINVVDQWEGIPHAVVPVDGDEGAFAASRLGSELKADRSRIVSIADPYTKTLTIEEIYQCLGKTPSEEDLQRFGEKYHEPVSCVTMRRKFLQENGVAIMYRYGDFLGESEIEWGIERCVNAGISLVIAHEYYEELPCIVVEEPLIDVFTKLTKQVYDLYNPVTVTVTGSMGKTTTKEMMTKVFETNFQTFCAQGNNNAIYQIGQFIQKLEQGDEAYIQEVHGGTPNSASYVSKLLKPDICVITNVVPNHISQIGTMEDLIENKLAIADGLKPGGVLILCHDNRYLRDAQLPVRTIRYSVSDTSCHYYAQNIREYDEGVSFEIVSRDSAFDVAGVYPASINVRGVHNVSNALAAFAAGRQAGIAPHKIIAGLARYKTTGIRQNVFEHGGIKMLVDTYNSNPKALLAMMDVFEQMQPEEDGKKILVLGMMGEQGDDSAQIHYDTGKEICKYDFDLLFCFGEDAKYLVKAAKECGREAYYFDDRTVFNRIISANVRPGDVMLVKGSHSMKLDIETLVPIFGSSIRQY